MQTDLEPYRTLLGPEPIDALLELASSLKGMKIVHINSVKKGGGVAEILSKMVPLSQALGLDVQWEIIEGTDDFFRCTKAFHNLLQGQHESPPDESLLHTYEDTNAKNAAALKTLLDNANIVFIHDPQPLALISHFPNRKGKWVWRCHIDLSSRSDFIWDYLKKYVELYDANIFSLKDFAQPLSKPTYIIPPSIDPFSEKNIELDASEILATCQQLNIDTKRPFLLQVSRFDRFKDPLGVIDAYRLAKKDTPQLQLVLAGSEANDDPEGMEVLREVQTHAAGDPDILILLLSPTAHRTINALQRGATIVLQKSLKEGFGLTVSEALWKAKPVIGGNVGGIRLQILDGKTGFLVNSAQEAANCIRSLLQDPQTALALGKNGHQHVKDHFLITRHLKDYLQVMIST